jgi:hypothetical protein
MLPFIFVILALIIGLLLGYVGARKSMGETHAMYQQQIEEVRKNAQTNAEQQQALFQQQLATVRNELTGQTERLLRERSQQLTEENKSQLSSVLEPLRSGLQQMKDSVEKTNQSQEDTMRRLDESIKATLMQTKLVGERADRLATALTGENKTQGNFGELRLRTLLENMGFEEGVQFEEQITLRDEAGRALKHDETGKKMIPDVILHFPDERDVVIDSKVSLKAFEDYYNTTDEGEQAAILQRHVASVRAHIKELSSKNYAQYNGISGRQRLDFVVMYMFSESALSLALAAEPTLWKEAYDQGVFITSSQNLYALLRVLEMSWTHQRQVENQQKIVEEANRMVQRVQLFCQRFDEVEDYFNKAHKKFDSVKKLLSPSGQSIVNAANRLVQLGAKQDARKAALPKAELLEIEEGTMVSHELRETTVLTEESANNVAVPFENPSLSDSDETDDPLFTITASPSQV